MHIYEDIKPSIRQGRARVIGYSPNPNGTKSRITKYEEYHKTKLGEYSLNDWTALAKLVIKDRGDSELYEKILAYISKYPWLRREKEEEVEHYACECLVLGAYKHWKDFEV